MFGLGVPELMVILVIALLIFGPKRLPEIGQNLGKALREFRSGAEQLKSEVENSVGLDEKSRQELNEALTFKDVRKDIEDAVSLNPAKNDSKKEEVQAKS